MKEGKILSGKKNQETKNKSKKRTGTKENLQVQNATDAPELPVRYTMKDSVFTHLFGDKKYLLQLYKVLHSEDQDTTEEQLTDITIRNVLTDNIYNDLGFMVGGRLIILVEAQSTWSVNIVVRVLMYMAQTYHDYFQQTGQDLYNSKKVKFPKPEGYVIYTGNRKSRPDEISLAGTFFPGEECCLDLKVKMIYDGEKGDIINQYVTFTRIWDGQVKIYGRTKKAILETLRICKDQNVLKEYLESREKEVIDIMALLYDEQEILNTYVNRKVREGVARGEKRGEKRGKILGIVEVFRELGKDDNEIAEILIDKYGVPKEEVPSYL